MRASSQNQKQRGAALLTTLMATGALAVLAVSASQNVALSLFTARLGQDRAQAEWHVRAAEDFAAGLIERRIAAGVSGPDGLDRLVAFPIDGGRIEASLSDAANCFNLNALAAPVREADDEDAGPAFDAERGFAQLLQALGVGASAAQGLAAATADYLDADAAPRPYGAETAAYAARRPPHAPAQGPIADISELLAVEGFDAGLYRAVAPFVCAHDTTDPAVLNLNTLRPDQAALLFPLVSGQVPVEALAGLIAERPADGFSDPGAFWAAPALQAIAPEARFEALTAVSGGWFALSGRVVYRDQSLSHRALFAIDGDSKARIVSRSVGDIL